MASSHEINFCEMCDNLTYLIIDEQKLKYSCKYCNTLKDVENINNGVCIYSSLTDNIDKSILLINNDYIKDDITLPTIINNKNINCPNESCESHETGSNIKYIKYDNDDVKYMYICNVCNYKWKNSK